MVSDILESNGSSSMASVCGSSLSLMDAGVPIKRPVAGIAMGLIKEGDDYIVLTDIAGVEDHLGDMDFKVAGTERGITALQMDIKISGVTFEILRDALTQANTARTFILGKMAEVIGAPREQLSQFAPRIQTIQIDPTQIGLLIGKGGETIRGLSEEFESQIDVNDDGQVLIYSANGELGDALVERIRMMMKEVEVGDEYVGKVVKTTTFGAFIELAKGTDGLLHISNVSPGERVETRRGRAQQGRRGHRARGRGRPRARPHRPAPADDPEIAGKSVEELAGVGTGGGGGGGGGREAAVAEQRPRAPRPGPAPARRERERGSGRPRHGATATDAAADRDAEHRITDARTPACGSSPSACPACARSRSASGSAPARRPSATSRRASRTCSSTCCSAAPSATAPRRSTRSSTRWAPSSTPAPTRRRPRSTRACSTATSSAPST